MINNFETYNESIRDQMTPKSDEELEKAKLDHLGFKSKHQFDKAVEGDGVEKVYHVWSGLDSFVFITEDETEIYLPYVSVLATSELDARLKTAKLLGQELYDQETNPSYKNHVDNAELKSPY